jgi:NADPH:quinone reductase-like Zn-dependent oxidoreductase
MRSVWIPRIGPPEVLELRDVPDPHAGPGEVRIRVAASGVNFADVMARMGLYPDAPKLPCVVGYEVSGTIDESAPASAGSRSATRPRADPLPGLRRPRGRTGGPRSRSRPR